MNTHVRAACGGVEVQVCLEGYASPLIAHIPNAV